MLWLLAYLIVGMVYASLGIYSAVREAIKKDKEHGHIILMSSLFLVFLLAVFCPALLTMKVATWINRKKESEPK
ncbi:hypothetical protein CON22_25975 [Bacillus cereus]|nr:hypothetical protein CON22_25975 [Bacillus cereus]